jgi:hypothetical protein
LYCDTGLALLLPDLAAPSGFIARLSNFDARLAQTCMRHRACFSVARQNRSLTPPKIYDNGSLAQIEKKARGIAKKINH